MNLAENLERFAFYFPDRPALSENDREIRSAQLNRQANRVATALLHLGVKPGEPVGLCAPNSADWVSFYFGVIKAGAVAVAFSDLLKKDELSLLVNHSRPRIIYTSDEHLNDLLSMRDGDMLKTIICPGGDMAFEAMTETGSERFKALERDRSDTAVILYTGGTTGRPKGAELSHENINASIQNIIFGERSVETDRAICFLPFNHVFGQMHLLNATILSCGCLEMLPVFDMDRILDLMQSGRVTKFFSVPTIYVRLLSLPNLKEKLGAIRYCFSAAASMAADVVRQWKERTGLAIHEGYGMTEAAPMITYNHRYRHVIGSVGTVVSGVEAQIRDALGNRLEEGRKGEICVRGPNIMKGYLNDPEATREAFWKNGWFRTGDVGRFDENGYLYIVDRIKEMIITGGENVYPREVEDALYTWSEVEECAVIGLPDRQWGERVTACIVSRPGVKLDKEGLKAHMKKKVSAFKVPKDFVCIDDFPRSPAGKILKRRLKEKLLEEP